MAHQLVVIFPCLLFFLHHFLGSAGESMSWWGKNLFVQLTARRILCKVTCSPWRRENKKQVGEIRDVKDPSVAYTVPGTGGSELVYISVTGTLINYSLPLSLLLLSLCQVQGRKRLHSVPSDRGPAGPHLPSAGHRQVHARVRVLQALPRVVEGTGGPLRGDGRPQHRAHVRRAHPWAPLHHQVPGVLTQPLGPRVQEHARLLHHRWVEEAEQTLQTSGWSVFMCVDACVCVSNFIGVCGGCYGGCYDCMADFWLCLSVFVYFRDDGWAGVFRVIRLEDCVCDLVDTVQDVKKTKDLMNMKSFFKWNLAVIAGYLTGFN